MNLPSGKPVKTGLETSTTDTLKLVEELGQKRFTGYLALCVKGQKGVEEATLLLDSGKIVAAAYEYYAYGRELYGEKAFTRFLNATAAKAGILDIYETSAEQIHLLLAFHEEAVFVPRDEDLRRVKVTAFSVQPESEIEREAMEKKEIDPTRKYQLHALTKDEPAPHTLPEHEEKTA